MNVKVPYINTYAIGLMSSNCLEVSLVYMYLYSLKECANWYVHTS